MSDDYRAMFDAKYLASWHLETDDGTRHERTVTIEKVEAAIIEGEGGRKDKKPLIHFSGVPLPMICNKTNARAIAGMYGEKTRAWIGRAITLYVVDTTGKGGQPTRGLRVRPTPPSNHAPVASTTPLASNSAKGAA